jgi:DNA-binding response OmpR family regulator
VAEDQSAPKPKSFVRGILLVEPYDALCIAISSALRRFAPHHALRVTQTLDDAEPATEMIKPDLFVLDLDPPPTGEVEFFNRLRRLHPDTRVLVIAPNASRDLSAGRGFGGAFQFIEKPFELGDFGAAVQALLGPWETRSGKKSRGTLRDLQAIDLVQLKCLCLTTAVLRVESPAGEIGEVHFRHGEIRHAFTDDEDGAAALKDILSWRGGKFREGSLPPKSPQTIDRPWQLLLLELLPAPDENADSLGDDPAPPNAAESLGKTILVIDDTEMLRIFAADVLNLADPGFRILTAATGAEGLQLATTNSVDLVLLDYCLADTTGAEVCRALLAHEATARVPVLMMSGHLPELENTARNFPNVVATLAKPFLSGALINEVEKILAAGPLPASPATPAPPTPKTDAAATNFNLPPVPNEHKTASNGHVSAVAPATPAMLVETPTAAAAPVVSRPLPNEMPATLTTDHGDVVATISCEVISVQLAPDFRMGALRLKPESSAVVRLNGANGQTASPLEKDFQLGPISLAPDGRIETVRLVPIPPFFRPAFGGGNFDVDWVSAEPAAGGALMELTGAKHGNMHVKLIAEFEVVRVELSEDFAVAAVVLRPRNDEVRVQTGENSAVAMHFYLGEIELDEAGLLAGLTVGSRR